MKQSYFTAASAILIAFALSVGQATAKSNPAPSPQAAIEQMESLSASMAGAADQLQAWSGPTGDPQLQIVSLDALRGDVNDFGRQLQALENERASLSPWEVKAIDEVTPRMREIAANMEKAIATFNAERSHLWATAFHDEATAVFNDAASVRDTLDDYLKLASLRRQEQRLETRVDESAGTR